MHVYKLINTAPTKPPTRRWRRLKHLRDPLVLALSVFLTESETAWRKLEKAGES